jgi:hypothetical protein
VANNLAGLRVTPADWQVPMVACEGAGWPPNSGGMCARCGAPCPVTADGLVVTHDRIDILRALNEICGDNQ